MKDLDNHVRRELSKMVAALEETHLLTKMKPREGYIHEVEVLRAAMHCHERRTTELQRRVEGLLAYMAELEPVCTQKLGGES